MEPTSDERREVAARLREAAKTKSNSADYLWKRLEIAVNGWRFGDAINDLYVFDNDVLARLADLIDPTCHLIGTTLQTWTDGTHAFYHELSCGHTCETVWAKPPEHCPECGARVVDYWRVVDYGDR